MTSSTLFYQSGDTVCYIAFGGETRYVRVDARYENIKNGEPGFDATMDDGSSVWGYDSQIISVIPAA